MTADEAKLQIMRLIAQDPAMDQRDLARELNLSLGKINYCLRALMEKGYVKFGNFRRSDNKLGYRYQLTPSGVAEKLRQTAHFLERKQQDYELLRKEIDRLASELGHQPPATGTDAS